MSFLPIVQRELQSRSRRGTTYWGRCLVAGAAVLFCFQFFLTYAFLWDAPESGRAAYTALTIMGLLLACSGVLLTADCVSVERREGTLGLLFLTDLKGYDVILGKLAANGLDAIYILVGFAPVIAVTILGGGITGGEVLRIMLAVLNTLWLALALGMWVSTSAHFQFDAMRRAIKWILGISLLPFLCVCASIAVPGGAIWTFMISPVFTFFSGDAEHYRTDPTSFWCSLVLVHLLSWFFLGAAARGISKRWRTGSQYSLEHESKENVMGPVRWAATSWAARFNLTRFGPICTQALRIPGQSPIIWTAAVLWVVNMFVMCFRTRWSDEAIPTGYTVAINLMSDLGCSTLIAWAAGRFIFETRQTGELEMLMCTPVGAKEIVSGQWRAMKRLLLAPAIFMVSLSFGLGLIIHSVDDPWFIGLLHSTLNIFTNIAFLLATCWLGMWLGSRLQKLTAAVAWTVGFVLAVPWLGVSVACAFVVGPDTHELTYTILNFAVSIGVGIYHWVLYRWARRKMEWEFSNYSKLSWSEFVERASEDITFAVQPD